MQNELIQHEAAATPAPTAPMNRIGRIAVVSGTALAMTLGLVAVAEAAPTTTTKAQLTTVFTPKKQTYVTPKAKQKAGILHAQVKLKGSYPKYYPMPWSWQITNKKLKAIATSTMNCKATGLNGKYHDNHAAIPVGYIWHSTVGSKAHPHKAKKVYNLSGTCVFSVEVGGKPGKATVGFTFQYAINPGKKSVAASAAPVTTTKVVLDN